MHVANAVKTKNLKIVCLIIKQLLHNYSSKLMGGGRSFGSFLATGSFLGDIFEVSFVFARY